MEVELNMEQSITRFIWNALNEDIGSGDHTSMACIPQGTRGRAKMMIKESGIVAGVTIAEQVFKEIEADAVVQILIKDGEQVNPGDIVMTVEAGVHTILKGERLALNLVQRMSGIATKTHHLVQVLNDAHTQILDTRKTTPGMRVFEKMAVVIGGGVNHRMGLYDMILIKDNHIDYAGGIAQAIQNTQNYLKEQQLDIQVEIEARNIQEVEQILEIGRVDRIMLDNFSIEDLKKALQLINGAFETEASGGITEKDLPKYRGLGLDYISMGEITHSVKSLDISLKAF